MYSVAINILRELENKGYKAYIVGGYVRDKLLNIESKDIDICTSATPDIIKNIFVVIEDNSKFGSLKIKENNYIFEITSFRIDTEYNGRYPKIIYTDDLSKDLERRDFTINSLYLDKNGRIVDLIDAKKDLNDGIIRCIGNPNIRLKEDPLRILRAIRFMDNLHFKLDKELEESIKENGYLLKTLSKNKTQEEIDKIKDKQLLNKLNVEQYIRR